MGTETISAIPTFYAGIEFRSRFEARTACLMDGLGWKWEYEPFSMLLPNGSAYTPDFLISGHPHVIVECRGYETPQSKEQLNQFIKLIENESTFKTPDKSVFFDRFLLIRSSKINYYTRPTIPGSEYFESPLDRPAWSERPAGVIVKCGCGWGFPDTVVCCNCCQQPTEAACIKVEEGRYFINERPVEMP